MIDPQDQLDKNAKQKVKDLAVRFCAALPAVFGESLDRTTLWDRIGTGIQSAYAKTAGDDVDFFVSQVLEHIKAEPTKSLSEPELSGVLTEAGGWSASEREAWLLHLATHLIPTLVYAKAKWEERKATKKNKTGKSTNARDPEAIKSFVEVE